MKIYRERRFSLCWSHLTSSIIKKKVTYVVEVGSVLDEVVPGKQRDEHFVVVVAQTAANLQHDDVLVEAVAPAPVLLDVVHLLFGLDVETESLEI